MNHSATTSSLPDRAIVRPEEDYLNRETFANALTDQILHAPRGQTLRIGIYGGLGEGKTSVLELMRRRLEAADQVCLWITPWTVKTPEEVLEQLIIQLTEKLGIDASALRKAETHTRMVDAGKQAAEDAWWSRAGARMFGEAIDRHFQNKVAQESAQFFHTVIEKLGERRVIVFIDDIDRVRPERVPELLLTLREALDQPNFYYVMALAPDVVQRGLRMVHRGWGGASNFLEKIIEYPRHLPAPTDRDIERFIDKSVSALGDALNATLLRGLAPLLPRNPRKLKLYLRLLASLHGLLSRFDPAEVDAAVFHLAQLMRSEFPEEARRMLENDKVIEDLRFGHMHDLMRERHGKEDTTTRVSPAIGYAPQEGVSSARFWQLYNAIRNRDALLRGRYAVKELFVMPDEPPPITWKELDRFLTEVKTLPTNEHCAKIRKWLSNESGVVQATRLEAAFHLVIEMRQKSLSQAADAKLDEDRVVLCFEASILTGFLRCLILELGAFAAAALPIEAWKELLQHVQRWGGFTKLKEYVELRRGEHELLKLSIAAMSSGVRARALELLGIHDPSIDDAASDFGALIRDLRVDLAKRAAETALDAFVLPDALDALLVGPNVSMRRILMFPSSPLYTEQDLRNAFLGLAERAGSDPIVQRNFAEFVGRLFYEAVERGVTSEGIEVRKLFADREVTSAAWRAAMTTPLNARTVGGLRLHRQRLADEGVLSEDELNELLPLPGWWTVLEDTFFKD